MLREVDETIDFSRHNTGMGLCLALNYGARAEIVDAVREIVLKAASGQLDAGDVTEDLLASHLYTAGMTDPDLVIRTAGEMRVSNFLLWQISYSELWVTPKCWPDFAQTDLLERSATSPPATAASAASKTDDQDFTAKDAKARRGNQCRSSCAISAVERRLSLSLCLF